MRLGVTIPSYGLGNAAAAPLLKAQQRCPFIEGDIELCEFSSSVLTGNHNEALCYARKQYKRGNWSHVLFMHSDVRPKDDDWCSTLIELQQRSEADLLGSIIPIKNRLGLTSTAIDTDRWAPRRITLQEAKRLPPIWTHPFLLINTGLLLIDLAKIADLYPPPAFQFHDEIELDRQTGQWISHFEPEDWNFSRQMRARGLRIFVTRALNIHHSGTEIFPSAPAWGLELDTISPHSSESIVVTDIAGNNVWLDNSSQQRNEAA